MMTLTPLISLHGIDLAMVRFLVVPSKVARNMATKSSQKGWLKVSQSWGQLVSLYAAICPVVHLKGIDSNSYEVQPGVPSQMVAGHKFQSNPDGH